MLARLRKRKEQMPTAWGALKPAPSVTVYMTRPPGVNNLFLNLPGRGRVLSPAYRKWRAVADCELALARPCGVRGPFHMSLSSERSSRRSDLDGILKGLLDALKRAGVIQDDNLLQSMDVEWRGRGEQMRVRITETREVWCEC